MSKSSDKKNIAITIRNAAQIYKKHFIGKTFLYIYGKKAIEVIYRAKDFLHLTGVDTSLSASDFYKEAVRNRLTHQQIFFSQRHPYDLCKRKMLQLTNMPAITNSALLILEGLTTDTFTYKFGLTELAFTVCLGKDTNAAGQTVSNYYVARSLRVEDSFSRANNAYEITFILSKNNDQKYYSQILFSDKNTLLSDLPENILNMIDETLR